MGTLALILLVAAFILFVLAAFYAPSPVGAPSATPSRISRVNLTALGLACWALSALLGGHSL